MAGNSMKTGPPQTLPMARTVGTSALALISRPTHLGEPVTGSPPAPAPHSPLSGDTFQPALSS